MITHRLLWRLTTIFSVGDAWRKTGKTRQTTRLRLAKDRATRQATRLRMAKDRATGQRTKKAWRKTGRPDRLPFSRYGGRLGRPDRLPDYSYAWRKTGRPGRLLRRRRMAKDMATGQTTIFPVHDAWRKTGRPDI
jgi:hypothetical protein